jgi:hypothetical protein
VVLEVYARQWCIAVREWLHGTIPLRAVNLFITVPWQNVHSLWFITADYIDLYRLLMRNVAVYFRYPDNFMWLLLGEPCLSYIFVDIGLVSLIMIRVNS